MNQQPNTSDADVTKATIKSAVDDETYETLKCDFDEVLRELEGNKNLEKFKDGYEKLMRAFSKSHDNEKLLMRKCRELKSEIVSSSAKVAQAANISSDDPSNVASLKREIEQAWKMVDAAADRETKAHATIKDLKEEIANLSNLLERGNTDVAGSERYVVIKLLIAEWKLNSVRQKLPPTIQQNSLKLQNTEFGVDDMDTFNDFYTFSLVELQRQKEKLLKERDEQISDNQKLREQIEETRNRIAVYQNELLEAQNKITELTVDLQNKNLEAQRELRKKERMEKDLKQVRSEVEAKMEEISSTSASVEKLKQELRTKDEENRTTKVSLEQANRHLQITEGKLKDCQAKLEQQIEVNESVTAQVQSKTTELKQREDEIQRAKTDYNRLLKQNELIHKKFNQIEEEKLNLQHTCEHLRNEINSYENEIELIRKTNELNKKACEEFNPLKQRKIIYKLERERDHYITEASELTQKILQNMDDIKLREMQIFENKKKIAEYETKLKQQQNLYEAGSDPSTYEMIQKIQALQKRLISKTEEVVEKELLIQEKEKVYIELKHILARQPGPEVAEQLNIYQNMIRGKTKQMKAMTAEMNVYESQITEYKIEIEHLNNELKNVKKTYFKQKRRQQQINNESLNNDKNCSSQENKLQKYHPHIKDSQSRFTGGGFKLTHVVS
ncbi:hypothetical protein Smp_156370 [Schistosoma mansoni]|uniref:hypothetical protein n=1 Tax=Schistosoma mansoni TaxID=6183 RepID=UPI00022DBF03|nr:hypothetical protein Smp_156370 [Schistosoma mansoni]|eukprot:XP_018651191.1 hypothetical protein Smp_156370 [Schistosoma mansoni]